MSNCRDGYSQEFQILGESSVNVLKIIIFIDIFKNNRYLNWIDGLNSDDWLHKF